MVRRLHLRGGVVAGTSAGASVMSETMLVRGSSQESHRIGDLHMAPGLGLIRDVIIDTPFHERGRIGRQFGAIGSESCRDKVVRDVYYLEVGISVNKK